MIPPAYPGGIFDAPGRKLAIGKHQTLIVYHQTKSMQRTPYVSITLMKI
jgi:hypothetical protein